MSNTHIYSSDVAFTPAVKAIQARKGSRDAYARAVKLKPEDTALQQALAEASRAAADNDTRPAVGAK